MKFNKVIFSVILVILLLLGVYLIYIKEVIYSLFMFLSSLFVFLFLIRSIKHSKDPYKYDLQKLLNSYDCLLVEISELPNLENKKIIVTQYFKDMLNVQFNYRKSIYYIMGENTCDFILMNDQEVYGYTLKKNESDSSILEKYIETRATEQSAVDQEFDIINSLEKTAIIRVDKLKYYKVSPVRDKELPAEIDNLPKLKNRFTQK